MSQGFKIWETSSIFATSTNYLERPNAYLVFHIIITTNQHDFQSSKSTNHTMHSFYEHLIRLTDACEYPVEIFCDLSNEFDCTDHKVLLN